MVVCLLGLRCFIDYWVYFLLCILFVWVWMVVCCFYSGFVFGCSLFCVWMLFGVWLCILIVLWVTLCIYALLMIEWLVFSWVFVTYLLLVWDDCFVVLKFFWFWLLCLCIYLCVVLRPGIVFVVLFCGLFVLILLLLVLAPVVWLLVIYFEVTGWVVDVHRWCLLVVSLYYLLCVGLILWCRLFWVIARDWLPLLEWFYSLDGLYFVYAVNLFLFLFGLLVCFLCGSRL